MTNNRPKTALKPFIAIVADGAPLTREQAGEAFDIIMSGDATDAQVAGFLMALRVRGETLDEIVGAVSAMRARMIAVKAPDGAMDIVGTGGDGLGTYNISTASAFVAAGAGVPVAKHGNKAVSSKSGAADVLDVLGVDLMADFDKIERAIAEAKIGFLMAPRHHGAMRHVMTARVELGARTLLNILGPLCNPAGVKRQFSGAFSESWIVPMAETLGAIGLERAWVVHGSDGLDDMTTTGPTKVAELKDGKVSTFEVAPEEAGLARADLDDLKGGAPRENAEALQAVLRGEPGPYRDIVLLNAAAALVVADHASSLRDGVARAAASIDEGRARGALDNLLAIAGGDL